MPCGIAGESALRSLANPLLGWKEGRRRRRRSRRRGRRRRGSSSVTAVKTSSPHPTTSQKSKRGGKRFSATTERALSRVRAAEDRGAEAAHRGLARFRSPAALDQGFLSLSEPVCLSLALLFQSVNVRSRSLVSGNDLTQQTGSSGQAEPTRAEEEEKEEEEERDRLLLAANSLCTSLVSVSTCFSPVFSKGDSL